MILLRNCLLILGLISVQVLHAQCSTFEIDPISIFSNLSRIEKYDFSTADDCDQLTLIALRDLTFAFKLGEIDEMHDVFGKYIAEVGNAESPSESSLNFIFHYGYILELLGRHNNAKYYFEAVKARSNEGALLHLLAQISEAGQSGRVGSNSELVLDFDKSINALPLNNQLSAINYLGKHMNREEEIVLLNRFYFLKDEAAKHSYGREFLQRLTRAFHYSSANKIAEIAKLTESTTSDQDIENRTFDLYNLSLIAKSRGDYQEHLDYARQAVSLEFGDFTTSEELIANYNRSPHPYQASFENYAGANLYQTRLGKGIEPVKDAFCLYETAYTRSLARKFSTLSGLTSVRSEVQVTTFENQLIVGNYLYEKTGNIDYLNRSIRIVDGFSGSGTLYWTKVREQMRKDMSFREEMEAIQAERKSLGADVAKLTLQELYARESSLRIREDAFRARYPTIFSGDFPEADLDLEALQTRFGRDSAATISFYNNGTILYRLFVSGDSLQVKILNHHIPEVERIAAELPGLLANPKTPPSTDTLSYRLYQLLFGDLHDALPRRVYVIATGVTGDIPYAGLRTSEPGQPATFFGTEHALSRQASIGSMLALRATPLNAAEPRPLALAPDFGYNFIAASELRQAGFALPPLLYSREEVEHLEDLSAGRFFYDQRATIDRYRRRASEHGIIHLASHAISSERDGALSRVFLLDGDGEPTSLYAEEIGKHTLNAELVVLSACETGGGSRHAVEGRVGLTKAYLAAGARSVVSSSWSVDDRATAELMNEFYLATADGKSPDDALLIARQNYLARHPSAPVANWAAFEAYGGMAPVRWERERSGVPFWWAGLGLAGLLMGGLVWRRKLVA